MTMPDPTTNFTTYLETITDPQTATHRVLAALTNLISIWTTTSSTPLTSIIHTHTHLLTLEFQTIITWYQHQTHIRAQLSELERTHPTIPRRALRCSIGKAETENLGGKKTLLWMERFEKTVSDRVGVWRTRIERVVAGFRFQRAMRTFTGVKLECEELEEALVGGLQKLLEADEAWVFVLKVHMENRRKVIEMLAGMEEKRSECGWRCLRDGVLDFVSDVEFRMRNL